MLDWSKNVSKIGYPFWMAYEQSQKRDTYNGIKQGRLKDGRITHTDFC